MAVCAADARVEDRAGAELTVLLEEGDDASALAIVGAEDGLYFLAPDADGNCFVIAPFDVDDDGVTLIPEGDTDEPTVFEPPPANDGGHAEASSAPSAADPPAPKAHGDSSDDEDEEEEEDGDGRAAAGEVRTGVQTADVVRLNSTRVFLWDPAKSVFYYADKAQGHIFCWDRATGVLRPVA
jgi:hypothetical protein